MKAHDRWRREWHEFHDAVPGRRFLHRFDQRAGPDGTWSVYRRVTALVIGTTLIAAGLFFAVMPGPAFVFYIFGGVLLGSASKTCARLLDWIDVRSNPWLRRLGARWRALPAGLRHGLAALTILAAFASIVGGVLVLVTQRA